MNPSLTVANLTFFGGGPWDGNIQDTLVPFDEKEIVVEGKYSIPGKSFVHKYARIMWFYDEGALAPTYVFEYVGTFWI